MTTRKRSRHVSATTASGGDGGSVTLGPEFGESNTNTVGVDASWESLTLGPFSTLNASAGVSLSQMTLGPFPTLSAGASIGLGSLSLGPFAAPIAGVTAAGTLTANGLNASHDTYLQEAFADTPSGAATVLLAKLSALAANNAERAFIAWDLTGYANTTITSATFHFAVETDATTSASAPWSIRTHPTQPFTESTATWNNSVPVPGTERQNGTVSAPSNLLGPAWAARSVVADATARANMPGNWVYLRFTGADALGVSRIRIQSKENGSPTQLPALDIQVAL